VSAVKGYAPIPHQLARAMGLSAHAVRVAVLLMSYTKPGSRKPAYPSRRHLSVVTGFGQDRVSKAIEELESLRVIQVERSRRGNRYYILPVEKWLVKAYEADSKVILNQEHSSSETETSVVPNQDTIKNKRLRPTDSEKPGKVASLATKGTAIRTSNGNGADSPLGIADPTLQHEIQTLFKQIREALKSKECISRPPALVEIFVTRCGPSAVPLDYLLDQIIHPALYGPKRDEFFVKLQASVTRAFEVGHVAYQLANETPAQREARITLATQRKLQRRANEGAIKQDPRDHHDVHDEDGGNP